MEEKDLFLVCHRTRADSFIHSHPTSTVPVCSKQSPAAQLKFFWVRRWVVGAERGGLTWLCCTRWLRGEDICYMAVRWGQLASVSEREMCEVIGQRGTCICCEVCDWFWAVTSGPRLANRLRMFLSDICSRTATGGILAMVAGRRVTSAFMSLSSSSSCLRTGNTTWT